MMRRLKIALCLVLLLMVAIGLLLFLWFSISVVRDGITDNLLYRFENTPREGLAYWRDLEQRRAWKEAIVPGLIWLAFFAFVVGATIKTGKRLFAPRTPDDAV